ncbi:hypothetical protein [Cyanobium sp. ATX-6F1]|uniref:hypothetical protein n=1 Tax=Cyanobium sp. ATX-6F1 TaxID=3137388 RepID=UPI0039BE8757
MSTATSSKLGLERAARRVGSCCRAARATAAGISTRALGLEAVRVTSGSARQMALQLTQSPGSTKPRFQGAAPGLESSRRRRPSSSRATPGGSWPAR